MNMSQTELGLLTPRRFLNKYHGWKAGKEERSAEYRMGVFCLTMAAGATGIKSPRDLWEIPGLDWELRPHLDEQELETLMGNWPAVLPGHKKLTLAEMLAQAKANKESIIN